MKTRYLLLLLAAITGVGYWFGNLLETDWYDDATQGMLIYFASVAVAVVCINRMQYTRRDVNKDGTAALN